jgi:FkbM family methyltransferase
MNPRLYIRNDFKSSKDSDSYSQFGQDVFVLKKIFKNKNNGFFVDIGANHPTDINNTYLLELKGWKGLAIEPQKNLKDLWPEARQTKCLQYVVGPENKKVEFVEGDNNEHVLSGVKGFNKCNDDQKIVLLEQKRLSDILKEENISNIDYLSIDVEGYEMNVLQSIDFSKINIRTIGIENDIGFKSIPILGRKLGSGLGNNKIRKFLINKGYKYTARIACDDFFIKK